MDVHVLMANLDAHATAITRTTAQFGSLVSIDRVNDAIIIAPGGTVNITVTSGGTSTTIVTGGTTNVTVFGSLLDSSSPESVSRQVALIVNEIVNDRDPTPLLISGIKLEVA
jgi:hypothetical protein